MKWNNEVFSEMLSLAVRAPSVHNVQPWKVQYTSVGFNLFQSYNRRLFVGDPKLHDNDVSLGCFIELCQMHLKEKGLTLNIVSDESLKLEDGADKYEQRFKMTVSEVPSFEDPLLKFVFKRRSHRGAFTYDPQFNENLLKEIKVDGIELKWITGPSEMKKWSALYDESSSQINQIPGYFGELIHWLRFKESDPRFHEDGLNRKALALGIAEAFIGSLLFKESIFKVLAKLKMEKILITEAPQIQSAQGIIVVYANKELSSIEMGRAFVRFWLELTGKGLYACPLTALVDFTHTKSILNSLKSSDVTIPLNVLRFGKVTDEKIIYSSPRLSIDRITIKSFK